MTQSAAVKRAVKAHTDRLKAAGGARLTVLLQPEAVRALDAICKRDGVSRTVAVNRLLLKEDFQN